MSENEKAGKEINVPEFVQGKKKDSDYGPIELKFIKSDVIKNGDVRMELVLKNIDALIGHLISGEKTPEKVYITYNIKSETPTKSENIKGRIKI